MMIADQLLFVASGLLDCRQTLKQRARLCDEIGRIADVVRRMELQLDDICGSAREDAMAAHAQDEHALASPVRLPRKPKLRLVTA